LLFLFAWLNQSANSHQPLKTQENKMKKKILLLTTILCLSLGFTFLRTQSAETTGEKIVFASERHCNCGNSNIYVMNADGSEQIRLTNNSGNDYNPTFSPDSSKIAFDSSYNSSPHNVDIYVMNADGTNRTKLTNNTVNDYHPSFSPDASKIVFYSNRSGSDEIYVMNADGSNQTRLTNNSVDDRNPVFSPDGSKIVYTSPSNNKLEIFVMNADGSNQKQLTNNPGANQEPSFSPDGSKIAFNSMLVNGNMDIYVMNADGSNQTRITNSSGQDLSPSFNLDGSKIAFMSDRDSTNLYEIYVMNADGTNQKRLTDNTAFDAVPSWGKYITSTYSISGVVTAGNTLFGLQGITISVGEAVPSVVTDVTGKFTISGLPNGTYTVTPSHPGSAFAPTSQTVAINGSNVTGINFQRVPCVESINPTSTVFSPSGGNGSINVTTTSNCPWTATSEIPWIKINSTSGNGNGTVSFTVDRNLDGDLRSGTILIGGKTFTVYQQKPDCSINLNLDPLNVIFPITSSGGTMLVNVKANDNCSWYVSSQASWITVNGQSNYSGHSTGTIEVRILPNEGAARHGTFWIKSGRNGGAIYVYNINQAEQSCNLTLNPTHVNIAAIGGSRSFNVSAESGCSWTALSYSNWITASGSGTGNGTVNFMVAPNTGEIRQGAIVIGGQVFTVIQAKSRPAMFDFDGDKKTDLAVFRPTEETWYILRSERGLQRIRFSIGTPTDKIVPADYDGDGKTDHAWIKANIWYVFQSSTLQIVEFPAFGQSGDIPVPGDWDGDGKADQAVYRMGANTGDQSYFYFRGSLNNPDGNITFIPFGQNGDVPVVGDYDGDGKQDAVIFRPSVGEWWYLRSSDGTNRAFQFGQNGDRPLSGDFTGDGKTDIAIFRPSTGEWFVLRSEDASYYAAPFGNASDVPVVGDYDGDGRDDIAVWRPSDGSWYVVKSSGGFLIAPFGSAGDKPIPSAFVP